ncbi:MAG: sulfite exporter TauE/SafE family protein [Saprospiraceae bacterium]
MSSEILFWVSIIGFSAGFLDAIVGGGGLIMTPAMLSLFPGFEILKVMGTNRTSSIFGTSIAAWSYFRVVKIDIKVVLASAGSAMVFAVIGVQLASLIDPQVLKIIVLVFIVFIAFYSYFKPSFGLAGNSTSTKNEVPINAAMVGALCGFYNGFIGPGTGIILVFAFVTILNMNFLRASAISKVTNVSGDLGSWVVLLYKGLVFWPAAIPLIISNIAGSFLGSRLAILKGSRFIRVVFFTVVVFMIINLLLKLIFSTT